MDNLTPQQRHDNMSHIRSTETKPEVIVRKYLFQKGLRYRKNDKLLPGHPDIVLPKYRTVVFIHGCFWHGHEGCKYYVSPKSNVEFWHNKILSNIERDAEIVNKLKNLGWKVFVVWTCELKTVTRDRVLADLLNSITAITISSSQLKTN